MTRYRKRNFAALTILLCLGIIFGMILYAVNVTGGTYTSTKHGSSTDGVDRSVVTLLPYPDANPYLKGHCGHCHEMHASIGGNEPPPTGDFENLYSLFKENYGADRNELCFACHERFSLGGMTLGYGRYGIYQGKTKYNVSLHYSSVNMIWSPDLSPPGPPYDDAGNCHNCHNPHGYRDATGLISNMLFARDSKTGDSPNYEMGCEACHDGSQGGAKDVKTQLNKAYKHPTHAYNNRHTVNESGTSGFGSTNRHAECVDCHNPHTIGSINSASPTIHPTTAVTRNDTSNRIDVATRGSKALQGVWGIEPSWPTRWTQPTSFTVRKPPTYPDGANKEYQICFKCHSYYGWGAGYGVSYDIAWHFNPNNCSAHPVVVTLNNQTGSVAPRSLDGTQMRGPFTGNVGSTTMYCSDCHGNDAYDASAPQGPHGSSRDNLLTDFRRDAQRYYWPNAPTGSGWSLYHIDQGLQNWTTRLLCKACHVINDGTWKNNVHSWQYHKDSEGRGRCTNCHTVRVHGGEHSRLIGGSFVGGFRKASYPTVYQASNCYIDTVCGGNHSTFVAWDCGP